MVWGNSVRPARLGVLAVGLALAAGVTGPARAAGPACPAPSTASGLDRPLPHTAARIIAGGPLEIVAIGSSSTEGRGASAPRFRYPDRLAAALHRRLPGLALRIENKGVGGETHYDMMRRFDRDVFPYHPDLVIWQLGTNAVTHEHGVSHDEAAIRKGVARLEASGADVILMNPQYAPKVLRDPDYPAMLRLLDDVGLRMRVAVFHRFAVMRDWIASGGASFATILAGNSLHMNDTSYGCIAELLAGAIVADLRAPATRPIETVTIHARH